MSAYPTIIFTLNGIERTLRDCARLRGLRPKTVYDRIYRWGWTIEEALELVPRPPSARARHRRPQHTEAADACMRRALDTIAHSPTFPELHRQAQGPEGLSYLDRLEMALQTLQRTAQEALDSVPRAPASGPTQEEAA